MPTPAELESLHHSDQRLLRTVDSLSGEDWQGPSLLPGWSRAHVVAHLALNAEGFAGALDGLARDEPVAIYPSNEARNDGIEELAKADHGEIRERLFAATTRLREVMEQLSPENWDGGVNRLPEGPVWPAASLVEARQREVEIHHADLGLAYTHRNWPIEFAKTLLDSASATHDLSPDSPAFTLRAMDVGRDWPVGAPSPVVTGSASNLGWWLIGRGSGEGLTSEPGPLPALGPWQRVR